MIRPIDIRLNAAHPELPLLEAVTYTGSPSTVLIRGVPPNCGRWAITAVFVAASFPDGSTTTRAAVQSANGVWVATLPATATSGRTANGIRIMADGIDENGEAVTGYILGVADFAVASLDVTPAPQPGETSWKMLYFDEVPSTLRKGDVAKIDGVLKFYNGSAWEPFAAPVTLDNTVTPTSANGVKSSGIWSAIWGALSALPTGFSSLYDWCVAQLAGKLNTSGGTMTGGIAFGTEDDYGYTGLAYDDDTHRLRIIDVWNENIAYLEVPDTADGSRVAFMSDVGNAAAAIAAKLDSTSAAPAFSSDSSTQYPVGSHVTYNGKLYKCTTATTGGTWDASKWTADTMTDPDAVLDITSQNQLRVVAKDGTLLWAQGYDLASTSSATLACDATNNFTFTDGATTQAFTLPTAPTGKVGDFGLDIDNSANTGAATMTLTGLDTAFSVVVPEGESLTDMLAIAAGELARFYITLSTFRVNNLPTWHIVKQVVENGGAQS